MLDVLLQAAPEAAAEAPGLWEWVKLIATILATPGVIATAFAWYKAYKRGELAKSVYSDLDAWKREAAADGQPDIAKALTRRLGATLEAKPSLKAEHERLLKAAVANAESILGPAIAKLSRGSAGGE